LAEADNSTIFFKPGQCRGQAAGWNECSDIRGRCDIVAEKAISLKKLSSVSIGLNRTVAALSVARLADALGNSLLFVVIPLYVAKLPAPWFPWSDEMRAGFLISLYGFVNAMLQPVAGALSDRLNKRKPFILAGLVLMGLGTLLFVSAGRFADLVVLRAIQGFGVALTIPASMALMAIASNRKTRGGSMGIYSTSRMAGFATGPLIGGFLYDRFGFDPAFYIGAALIAVALILVQLMVREIPQQDAGRPVRRFQVFDRRLLSAGILGAALSTFMMAGAFAMMTPLEARFNARLHETALDFGIAFSALLGSRLVLQIPIGRLSDRFGRKPFIIGGLLLMGFSTAVLGEARSSFELIWLRVIQGAGAAGIAAPAFALAADLAHRGGEARQMSVITMGFGLGIATGPLLAGLLAGTDFDLPFVLVGALLVISAWIIYRKVPETVGRKSEIAADPN
jgi:MFS family permease